VNFNYLDYIHFRVLILLIKIHFFFYFFPFLFFLILFIHVFLNDSCIFLLKLFFHILHKLLFCFRIILCEKLFLLFSIINHSIHIKFYFLFLLQLFFILLLILNALLNVFLFSHSLSTLNISHNENIYDINFRVNLFLIHLFSLCNNYILIIKNLPFYFSFFLKSLKNILFFKSSQ
jgi:hypothetical protein